jgi:hypothetical protein
MKRPEVLKEYLIGAGGWAYFQVPGVNSLAAYSKVFNFVEVNSTLPNTSPECGGKVEKISAARFSIQRQSASLN